MRLNATATVGKVIGLRTVATEETKGEEWKNERMFSRVALFSVALGFGAEFATIQSLGLNPANFSFQFSVGTVVAFLMGAGVGASFWKVAARGARSKPTLGQRISGGLLILGSVGGFLYPLRFLSHERLTETLQGLAVAALTLSLAAFILWRIRRFLESDAARTEDAREPSAAN